MRWKKPPRKGIPRFAGLLEKVLAIEPANREALFWKARLILLESQRTKSFDDQIALIDKGVAVIRSLMRTYESSKPNEKELLIKALYNKFKLLAEKGQIDRAITALKETSESGRDAFAKVDLDDSLAKFRSSPQYKAARKVDDDQRLATARERTKALLNPALILNLTSHFPAWKNKEPRSAILRERSSWLTIGGRGVVLAASQSLS